MDLSGRWRAAPADEELRRTFAEPDHVDDDWPTLPVPGHWADHADFADATSVLYRRRFATSAVEGRRSWLRLEGIAQQADVWLDGDYLGDTDGYFVHHVFEITEQRAARDDHLLGVDVSCRGLSDPTNRSALTGALQDPELTGGVTTSPGGVWQPVHIYETGPVAVRFFRAICTDASITRARIALRMVLDVPEAAEVTLRTRVAGVEHDHNQAVAVGDNRIEWTVDVPDPERWWPHALGDQPLHPLEVDVVVDGEVHDHRSVRIGFRTVRMKRWHFEVNGERLFVKGTSLLPTRQLLGNASTAEVIGDVRAAREAGLDLVRPLAHIARRELYDAADELGMLVWQDMPLRGRMARGVRAQARRQAREAVDLLGHHPSIVVWCAHDRPFSHRDVEGPTVPVLANQAPSWNRTVLDRSVSRTLTLTDGSRPVVPHTGVAPNALRPTGTTSELWFGWRGGGPVQLAAAIGRFPRLAQFVSAFGAVGVEPTAAADPRWPDIDWDRLAARCGTDTEALRRFVAADRAASGTRWAELSQLGQADVVKSTIEILRRLKYRPTGGFIHHLLADPSAEGGFGVLDVERRPKPAWQALVDACRPVIVVADPLPPRLDPGDELEIGIHVVSDRRSPIADAVVRAHIAAPGIDETTRWGGEMAADSCTFIGTLEVTVPDHTGPFVLDLDLTAEDVAVTNRYRSAIGSVA